MGSKSIKINKFRKIPRKELYENGFSYRHIACEIEHLIKQAYNDPLVKELIDSGNIESELFIQTLGYALQKYSEQLVSKPLSSRYNTNTHGFGRRIVIMSSDGSLMLDTSYQTPNSGIFFAQTDLYKIEKVSDIQQQYDYAGVTIPPLPIFPLTITQKSCNIKAIKQKRSKYGGKAEPENYDDKNKWEYQDIQLHGNRSEMQVALIQNYGWTSRYSGTTSNFSYYVARKITLYNNYTFILRMSYEALPL